MISIKVSRGDNILYETFASKEGNITSLVSSIRTVQKCSNEYLSKLVIQEKSSNNTERQSEDENMDGEEDNDSEDDTDQKDKSSRNTKEMETGKRKNVLITLPNSKKSCSGL